MNKATRILLISLVALTLLAIISPVFATTNMLMPSEISATYDPTAANDIKSISGKILGLIRNIAVIAGVLILSVIGVKFIFASAEEKAEYKKSLMPLVVGIVVVMGATQITTMIFGFLD